MRIIAALIFGLCLGVTCEPPPPVPPPVPTQDAAPPPAPIADAGSDDGEAADDMLPPEDAATACGRACARLRRLDCPGGEGSPGGASCEEVCEHQNSSGIGSWCTSYVERIQGRRLADGGRECDEDELQRAFEACE